MRYTAEQLEKDFKYIGRARKNNPIHAGDATYWDGGHCNYGASHNLKEDCRTLEKAFTKLENLSQMKKVLLETASQSEFDSKKSYYLTQCNETLSGLTPNYGAHSSMFGICILWSENDTNKHIETKIKACRQELEQTKSLLSKETYQAVVEIRQISLEIRKLEDGIREKQREAQDPNTSPQRKLALLAEVEEDGKQLKQKYARRKELDKKFNFNFDKHISALVEAMKKIVEGNSGSSGNGSSGGDQSSNPYDFDSNNSLGGNSTTNQNNQNNNNNRRSPKKEEKENNNQLLIYGVIALIIVYFLLNQKENHDY